MIAQIVYRELVKSVAPEGPVMVTWANLHYLDFVLNWVEHVRSCGIKAFLVGAMDDRILQVTLSKPSQLRCILMEPRSTPSHGACMRPINVKDMLLSIAVLF